MPQEWRKKMKIRVKKLDEHAVLPTRGSVDAVIAPAQTRKHLIMAFSML